MLRLVKEQSVLDILLEDYPNELKKIINHCQFVGKPNLDLEGLNFRLRALGLFEEVTSLSEDEWYELIFELTPDVYDSLSFGKIAV